MGIFVCKCKGVEKPPEPKPSNRLGQKISRSRPLGGPLCPYDPQNPDRPFMSPAPTPSNRSRNNSPTDNFLTNPTKYINVSLEGFDDEAYCRLLKTSYKTELQDLKDYAQEREALTEPEAVMLVESWKVVEGHMQRVGVIAFISLFHQHPEYFKLFNKFTAASIRDASELSGNVPIFAEHVLLVMQTLGKVLHRIRDPERIEEILHNVGDMHRSAGVGRDVFLQVRPYVVEAIGQVFEEENWTPQLQVVWFKFSSLTAHVICERMYPRTIWYEPS